MNSVFLVQSVMRSLVAWVPLDKWNAMAAASYSSCVVAWWKSAADKGRTVMSLSPAAHIAVQDITSGVHASLRAICSRLQSHSSENRAAAAENSTISPWQRTSAYEWGRMRGEGNRPKIHKKSPPLSHWTVFYCLLLINRNVTSCKISLKPRYAPNTVCNCGSTSDPNADANNARQIL